MLGGAERVIGCCESDADEADVSGEDLAVLFVDDGLQIVDGDGSGLEGFDFVAAAAGP